LGAKTAVAVNAGVTPLMLATAYHDYQLIDSLLHFGADINAISKSRQTALTIAIEEGDERLVQFLINKGADVSQKLSVSETPLSVARYLRSDAFIIENLVDKGATVNHWPNFRIFFVGPAFTFNNNDFLSGIHIGVKELKYELDVSAGFLIRPYASRILEPVGGGVFYQYWERRSLFFIGIDKYFLHQINRFNHRQGVFAGYKQVFSFSGYRGVSVAPSSIFVPAPEAGIYYETRRMQAGFAYSYCNFGMEGIAPHKLNFYVRLFIGRAFSFNKEKYSLWE
jgi:hypothetical protein